MYVLDKAYRFVGTGSLGAARVVVAADRPGECRLPIGANVGGVLGITMHSQPSSGRAVAVRKSGIATAVAAGPIPYGAPVVVADATGRVRAITDEQGTRMQVVGFAESECWGDGQMVEVFLAPHERLA
jgi:hypothetical protein